MESGSKSDATIFAFVIAKRIAKLLLPLGFSLGDFFQAARAAFVEAATDHIEDGGNRASNARIAVVTGISRAEVARIRSHEDQTTQSSSEQRAERVMHGWFTDARFVDSTGTPKPLRLNGDKSFTDLVRIYSGDIPKRAVLEELRAGGMVTTDQSGLLTPIRRHYLASSSPHVDLAALAADTVVLFQSASIEDDTLRSALRRLSISFPHGIPPSVRRTVALRTERFLDSLSDYLHAESTTAPQNGNAERQFGETFRLIISQSTGDEAE